MIAINPTKDAAIFIGMNQVGADPAEKAVESSGACCSPLDFIARALCFSIFAASIPSPKARQW